MILLLVLAFMEIKIVLRLLQLSIIEINQSTLENLILINFCQTWVLTDIFKTKLCSFEVSEFIDQHHKHILSSNFKNIRDNKLVRDLNIEKTGVFYLKNPN